MRTFLLGFLLLAASLASAKDLPPRDQLVVVVGFSKEAELAQGKNITVVISSADSQRLKQRLEALNLENVRAIVSYGVAGGLDPEFRTGDVIIPHAVIMGDKKWATDSFLSSQYAGQIVGENVVVHSGILVGSDTVVPTPEAKAALRGLTGAVAVDMESHIAAQFAADHGVPFAVVRVISDPADRALPSATENSIKPNGDIRKLAVFVKAVVRGQLRELIRTGIDSSKALSILEKCRSLLEPTSIQAAE